MSGPQDYSSNDPLDLAAKCERNLNSEQSRKGHDNLRRQGASDSVLDSGIDDSSTRHFPGSNVVYGSAASGAGGNREIPENEGGGAHTNGRPLKAKDFEGLGGPEDKAREYEGSHGGYDDVIGKTMRPMSK